MEDTVINSVRELMYEYMKDYKLNPKFIILTDDLATPLARELYNDFITDEEYPSMTLNDIINAVYSGETKLFGLTVFVLNSRNRKNKAIWIG